MRFRTASVWALLLLASACHKSKGAGSTCQATSDCASGLTCEQGTCTATDGGSSDGGDGGAFDAGPPCLGPGTACGPGTDPCCSGLCETNDAGAQVCRAQLFCAPPDATCTDASDCCTGSCVGGRCAATTCAPNSQACAVASDCCSGICNGTHCAAVPGATCGTLGQVCSKASDCCSTNCQGGRCARAYVCNAPGDICFSGTDCCSGSCSASAGQPGVCQTISGGGSGGCWSDGTPCSSGVNCCSRLCIDVGSGAKVCAPASGCRLTGDLCTQASDCCGAAENGVRCTILSSNPPIGRCTNPTGCEPVGDICGAYGSNARQDCCDGHKAVCALDSEGIQRCFGGCPSGNCPQNCPEGYATQSDGGCCIGAGQVCQFKDQCCDGSPCLPDSQGVLRCTPAPSCVAAGSTCSPASGPSGGCCSGLSCLSSELGYTCGVPRPGSDGGSAVDAGPSCHANGGSCAHGTDCCSGYCVNGSCSAAPACQPQNGVCTASADCCLGLTCAIPGGSNTGTCQPGATCGQPGQPCSQSTDCCAGLGCMTSSGAACSGSSGCTCSVIFK